MQFIFNDGGRAAAGYKGTAGDCAARAIAIASGEPYQEVYDAINLVARDERPRKRQRGRSNARLGTFRPTSDRVLTMMGARWTPTMQIGSGCQVHLRADELPAGRLVVKLSRHLTAVIDGVIYDTYNPDRDGTRCVYGYWTFPA